MLEVRMEKNYFSVTNNNKESPDVSSILFLSKDSFLTDLQNVSWIDKTIFLQQQNLVAGHGACLHDY